MHIGSIDCPVDCGTTNTILKSKDYYVNIIPEVTSVTRILGPSDLDEGFDKAQFMLSNHNPLTIDEGLYCTSSSRNLSSIE